MSTNQLILVLWLMILVFSLYAIGRIFYQFRTIPMDYLIDEKFNFDSKLNPYKIKIYCCFTIVFGLPFFFHKIFIEITSLLDSIIWFLIALIYVSISYCLLEFKIKSETKIYIQNPNIEHSFVKVDNQLKPSLLTADEIKKQFDYALEQNYFNCEISQFENLLELNEPVEKIIWKPISRAKYKDRQLLLSFLHNLFQEQLNKKSRKGICEFVNKYFELNEIGHNKQENPFRSYNIEKWINNPKSVL